MSFEFPYHPDSTRDMHGTPNNESSSPQPVVSVARRNERERKRVRLVNQGFAVLRDKVPRDSNHRGRRTSKVETLRAAILYIRQLQQLLLESQAEQRLQTNYRASNCYAYFENEAFFNGPPSFGSYSRYPAEYLQSSTYSLFGDGRELQYADETLKGSSCFTWYTVVHHLTDLNLPSDVTKCLINITKNLYLSIVQDTGQLLCDSLTKNSQCSKTRFHETLITKDVAPARLRLSTKPFFSLESSSKCCWKVWLRRQSIKLLRLLWEWSFVQWAEQSSFGSYSRYSAEYPQSIDEFYVMV